MSNNVDYCEILLQTIDILNSSKTTPLGAAELSSTSLEQPTMVVNPFASILEREVLQLASQEIELEGNTEQSSQEIWRLQEPDRAYDRLVISFKSKVSEMPTDEFAHYGIELTLMAMNMDTTVVFDSSEFFGNPWSTSLAMLQKQSFDLSSLIGLQAIKVKIYNYSSSIITIQGLHLGIGYALENYNVDGTPLTLFVESDTELKYYTTARKLLDGEKTKNIEIKARWIYGEGIEKRAITDLSSLPDGMSLRWYKHTPQNAQGDQFSGSYWWEIPNNTGFSLNLTAESNYYQLEDQNTQFKAVLVAQGLGGGLPQVYTSNIITVVNVQAKSDDLVFDHLLELEDKTNGLYTFYDFDDNIDPRYFAELNQIRSVFFKYSTRYSDIISHIKKIVWKIPNGLLEFVDAPSNVYSDNGYNYYETNNAITETNLEMKYKLSSTRSRGATKSKIVCIIYDDQDQTYSAEKEIALLMASNTDNPTVIRLLDDGNNIVQAIRDINKTYYLSAKIYNDQGEELTPKSIDVAEIKNAGTVKVTQLESKSNFSVKVDNAASINILKITFTLVKENNGKTLQVVEYYPIAITNADWVYAGPTEIVYESNGNNPSFSPAAAAIQNISDVNWETQKDISQTVAPVIDADTGIITPKVAYDPEMFGHYAIKATQGGNYWLQPIIIYMKPFYSRIINDWDGRLSINNDNNYIMASAYVAGSKDKDNKFTGAILGELATITEDKKDIRENGLFGYAGGQQTFGLKSDGTAFFGASGKGRINIDGNGGTIESGNFDINAQTGTKIDLTNGSFSFGGGRFKYDSGDQKITLQDVTISWDSTNAPDVSIEDVDGLSTRLGNLDTAAGNAYTLADSAKGIADNAKTIGDDLVKGLGFKKTEITNEYIISPVIAGGHLLIGDTSGTYAQITTNGTLSCANAIIHGSITATSLTLGTGVKVSTNDIEGLSTVATSGDYKDLSNKPNLDTYASKDSLTNYVLNSTLSNTLNGYATTEALQDYLKTNDLSSKLGDLNVAYRGDVQVTQDTNEETGLITTVSTYTSTDGTVHSHTTYTTKDGDYVLLKRDNQWGAGDTLVKISKEGLLEANNAIIAGTIYATDSEFTGTITATKGQIGGLGINTELLPGGPVIDNLSYGNKGEPGSFILIPSGNYSNLYTTIAGNSRNDWSLMIGPNFGVTKNGEIFADDINFKNNNTTAYSIFSIKYNTNYWVFRVRASNIKLQGDGFVISMEQGKPSVQGASLGTVITSDEFVEYFGGPFIPLSTFEEKNANWLPITKTSEKDSELAQSKIEWVNLLITCKQF